MLLIEKKRQQWVSTHYLIGVRYVRHHITVIQATVFEKLYFSFQPVLHDWCNKGCGMCYPVCGMVHIKEPLLLIDKSSLCGGSGFLSHYQNGP